MSLARPKNVSTQVYRNYCGLTSHSVSRHQDVNLKISSTLKVESFTKKEAIMRIKEESSLRQSILQQFFPKEKKESYKRTLIVTLPSIEVPFDNSPSVQWMSDDNIKEGKKTIVLQPIAYQKIFTTSKQPYFAMLHYDTSTQAIILIGSPMNVIDKNRLIDTFVTMYPEKRITFQAFPSTLPFSSSVENIALFAARIANQWDMNAAMDTTDIIDIQKTIGLIKQHYKQLNSTDYADYLLKQSLNTNDTNSSIEWITNNVLSQFEEVLKGNYDLEFMIEAIIERQSIYYNGEKCSKKNLSKDNIMSVISELNAKYDHITMASITPLNSDGSINTEGYTLHDPNRLKIILDMTDEEMLRCNLAQKLLIESTQFKLISNTGLDESQVKANLMLQNLVELGLLSENRSICIQEELQKKFNAIKTELRAQLRDNYLIIQQKPPSEDWIQVNNSSDSESNSSEHNHHHINLSDNHEESLLSRISRFLGFKSSLKSVKQQSSINPDHSNQTDFQEHVKHYFQENLTDNNTLLNSLLAMELIDILNEKKDLIHISRDTPITLDEVILEINSHYHLTSSINDEGLNSVTLEQTHDDKSINQTYFIYEAAMQRPMLLLKKSGLDQEAIKNMSVSDVILYGAAIADAVAKTCDEYNEKIEGYHSYLDHETKFQQFKTFQESLYPLLSDDLNHQLDKKHKNMRL